MTLLNALSKAFGSSSAPTPCAVSRKRSYCFGSGFFFGFGFADLRGMSGILPLIDFGVKRNE